jgi:hypothetical protein
LNSAVKKFWFLKGLPIAKTRQAEMILCHVVSQNDKPNPTESSSRAAKRRGDPEFRWIASLYPFGA